MILFLGVARALEAMHNYRIKGAPGGSAAQERARGVRQFAADEDADAAQKAQRASNVEAEQTPLMPDEITQSQEGIEAGELRAYAHRDIKPGGCRLFRASREHDIYRQGCFADCLRKHNDSG